MRSVHLPTGTAQRLLVPSTAGLDWPSGGRGRTVTADERGRLLHYERLMGLAHLMALPTALGAALVHVETDAPPARGWLTALVAAALVHAAVYHLWLPRRWCSRTKVVLGLAVDTGLVTGIVVLTGYHMSLLVFLYYLIVIASALTLSSRALYAICGLVTAAFLAMLPFDPEMRAAAGAHAGHVVLFVVSVWVVGVLSAAAAAQIQAAERRLMASLRDQQAIARENARLSSSLANELAQSRALAVRLQQQREETRRLADMVIHAQEEERRRVARELHDEANQTLAALMTGVEVAETLAEGSGHLELQVTLARLRRLAGSTLTDLQRIATELRPPALDEFGLLPALTRHVRDRTAGTGLVAEVDTEGRRRRLSAAVEVALYRIAQEALANVQKHGRAHHVHLRLRFLPRMVRLDVSDDGVGFESDDAPPPDRMRLGIAGMRERASIVGGTLTVETRPGGGTRVSACIPVEDAAEPPAFEAS